MAIQHFTIAKFRLAEDQTDDEAEHIIRNYWILRGYSNPNQASIIEVRPDSSICVVLNREITQEEAVAFDVEVTLALRAGFKAMSKSSMDEEDKERWRQMIWNTGVVMLIAVLSWLAGFLPHIIDK